MKPTISVKPMPSLRAKSFARSNPLKLLIGSEHVPSLETHSREEKNPNSRRSRFNPRATDKAKPPVGEEE